MAQNTGARKFGLSAAVLKYIAVITMLIDHLAASGLKIPFFRAHYNTMRDIGRIAFPLYCFFIAEGLLHTKSRPKYLRNLLLCGLLSQVPYHYALYPSYPWDFRANVLFSLSLGLAAIWAVDELEKRIRNRFLWAASSAAAIAAACWAAVFFRVSYQWGAVLTIAAFYLFRKIPALAAAAAYGILCYYSSSEVPAWPAFLLILLYSGEKGRQNKLFFYAFYPVHLALIALLKFFGL